MSADSPQPARMTLSRVIEQLLARGASNASSVTLSRNAKGETQIEVTIRTDAEHGPFTYTQAETAACLVFDRLRARYPMQDGTVGAGGTPAEAAPKGHELRGDA